MSHSQRLRSHEVMAAYHLIGECREVGADAQSWMRHFNESIVRLVGGQLCHFHEVLLSTLRPLIITDSGWATPSDRNYMMHYLAANVQNQKLVKQHFDVALVQQTCVSGQVITDREWYGSDVYNDYMKPTGVDTFLVAAQRLPGRDSYLHLMLQRPLGARRFPPRAQELARLCLAEVARVAGTQLAGARDPSIEQLAPRVRQVLRCLLEGDSEQQAARRLGLQTGSVHQYVKNIYSHFRVSSRAELLAYFLRRSGLRLDFRHEDGAH